MNSPLKEVQQTLEACAVPKGAKLVVGASGGCDSTVLLHLMHELGHPLVVAHVNHGARGPESDEDERFVRTWAEKHGAAFECLTLDAEEVSSSDQGFQGEARKRRLTWMASLCDNHKAHAIALGHHADDQAETWFLHAIRSTDPWSIMGMAAQEGQVIRPMLNLRRHDIQACAEENAWHWREDKSNASAKYLRNRIRHELLPLLENLRPGSTAHFQRLASRARDLHDLLAPALEEARAVAEQPEGCWSIEALTTHPWAMEAMTRVLKDRGWSDASAQSVRALMDADVGKEVQHGSKRVVRERHALVLTTAASTFGPEVRIDLETGAGSLTTPAGTFTWTASRCPDSIAELSADRAWIPPHCLPAKLRVWNPGDKIQPLGMDGHSKVSDVLTQAKAPSTLKGHALVLERLSDGHVLWVVGHKLAEEARINVTTFADTQGVELTYTPSQQP